MLRLDAIDLNYTDGPGAARRVLERIDLAVGRGERLALCGPSGAGKTSLLSIMAGLMRPSGGEVVKEPGLHIGLALQEPEQAFFARSVREELSFAPRRKGLRDAEIQRRNIDLLSRLGLSPEILGLDPFRLAPAERRLVAIAAVLAGGPDLLLLDEPSVGLDMSARGRLMRMIDDYQGAVVIAGHDLDLLWRLCPRATVLYGGVIAFDGSWDELIRDPAPLDRAGLGLPEPCRVYNGLLARGWRMLPAGRDDASLAGAILAGGPEKMLRGPGE